jgi:hypothetical protein
VTVATFSWRTQSLLTQAYAPKLKASVTTYITPRSDGPSLDTFVDAQWLPVVLDPQSLPSPVHVVLVIALAVFNLILHTFTYTVYARKSHVLPSVAPFKEQSTPFKEQSKARTTIQ